MKNFLLLIALFSFLIQPCQAWSWNSNNKDENSIEKLLKNQVK